jgi:hypothetical protein
MAERPHALTEICFSLTLLGVVALVVRGARDIPPAVYDPVGSAALPLAAAAIVGAGAATMLGDGIRLLRGKSPPPADPEAPRERAGIAIGLVGAFAAYILLMSATPLGFRWATFLFLVASGLILARDRRRMFATVLAVAAAIAVGGHYLFTTFFFIALP